MLWEMAGVTVAELYFINKTRHTEVQYCQQRTSFLFVVVDLPFGCSWALTNLDQSYFTICGSIEDFLSCANIIDIILELIPLMKSYVSGHGDADLPPSLLYNSKTDGGPGTSIS